MTAVRTYLNKMEAELAKGLLASEDIDSVIQADDCDGMRPNLWLSGVRLLVRPEDVARADKVLAEVDSEIS
jgi:hypothetical protein